MLSSESRPALENSSSSPMLTASVLLTVLMPAMMAFLNSSLLIIAILGEIGHSNGFEHYCRPGQPDSETAQEHPRRRRLQPWLEHHRQRGGDRVAGLENGRAACRDRVCQYA